MNKRLVILSLLGLASFAASTAGMAAQEAVRELGQPDFHGFTPNRLDARGLAYSWGVAIDTSRSPNGIWVLPASLCNPMGVAVGPGDELFVSDAAVSRVVVFELP
jgi:hypothetical protein